MVASQYDISRKVIIKMSGEKNFGKQKYLEMEKNPEHILVL